MQKSIWMLKKLSIIAFCRFVLVVKWAQSPNWSEICHRLPVGTTVPERRRHRRMWWLLASLELFLPQVSGFSKKTNRCKKIMKKNERVISDEKQKVFFEFYVNFWVKFRSDPRPELRGRFGEGHGGDGAVWDFWANCNRLPRPKQTLLPISLLLMGDSTRRTITAGAWTWEVDRPGAWIWGVDGPGAWIWEVVEPGDDSAVPSPWPIADCCFFNISKSAEPRPRPAPGFDLPSIVWVPTSIIFLCFFKFVGICSLGFYEKISSLNV